MMDNSDQDFVNDLADQLRDTEEEAAMLRKSDAQKNAKKLVSLDEQAARIHKLLHLAAEENLSPREPTIDWIRYAVQKQRRAQGRWIRRIFKKPD